MSPIYRIAEIELLETPVVLRMPFRFGIVTLRKCFQAFVRVRIETSDGKSSWGATAEMIAPKWFDKNPNLTDDENFEQERNVLRIAREAYLSDASQTPRLAISYDTMTHTFDFVPQKVTTHF